MKILIVQTSFLGDTILSTPVIKEVKNLYPDSEIWMMTTPLSSQLVERNPDVNGVITYDKRGSESGFKGLFRMAAKLRAMDFDMVYSLHKSYRTSALLFLSRIKRRVSFTVSKLGFLYHERYNRDPKDHDVLRNLSILSGEMDIRKIENPEMKLFPLKSSEIDQKLVEDLDNLSEYAVLVPGSAWETKMWDSSEFRQAAEHILSKGLNIVLLGSKEDKGVCSKVAFTEKILDLSGKTSIEEAIYVVSRAKLIVCNDSMSLHMGSALRVPTVVAFCATVPEQGFGPWMNRSIIIEKKLKCRPCGRHGARKCPLGTDECMSGLFPKTKDAIDKLLDEN